MAIDIISYVGPIFWILVVVSMGLAFTGITGAFMFLLMQRLKYKIKVDIFEDLGGIFTIKEDRAREVKGPNGEEYLQLLKTKDSHRKAFKIPIPSPSKTFNYNGLKKLYIHRMGNLFNPMPVESHSPAVFKFEMDELISVLRWREQDHMEALDNYRDPAGFWERNQVIIMFGAMMLVIGVMMFILIWQLQNLNITVDMSQTVS